MDTLIKRNLEIDRLRSIAALIVVFCHLIYIYYPDNIDSANGFATTIIDLYFVISGYVISCALIRQIDQLKKDNVRLIQFLKGFFIKRIFRIYPPLWATFFLILLSSYFFNVTEFSSPVNTMQSSLMLLTSTFNFYFTDKYFSLALAPLWSLAIEEQFYIIFPVFLLLTKNNRQRIFILAGMLCLITFILRPLTLHYYPNIGLFFTQTRCDAIIYGVLIYMLSKQPWFDQLKPAAKGNQMLRMAFVALLLYVIIGLTTLDYSPAVYLSVNCLVISLLLLVAVFERNIVSFPPFFQTTLDILAPRTYSLYIIHFPVILAANQIFPQSGELSLLPAIIKMAGTVMIIFISSELLYRLVLIPFLNKGKMIADEMFDPEIDKNQSVTKKQDELAVSQV